MAKLPSNYDLSNINDPTQFMQYSSIMNNDMANAINGGLQFDQNMSTQTVSVVFASADTEVVIPQSLNRVPTGYLIGGLSVASIVYTSTTAWTGATIYLKASMPCTALVVIF